MSFCEAVESIVSEEVEEMERSFDKIGREVEDAHLALEKVEVVRKSETEVRSKRDGELGVLEEEVSSDTSSSPGLKEGLVSDRDEFSMVREDESHCRISAMEAAKITGSNEVETAVTGESSCNLSFDGNGDMITELPGENCLKEDHRIVKTSSEQEPAMENEAMEMSTVQGMKSDEFNEKFCFSVEELQDSTDQEQLHEKMIQSVETCRGSAKQNHQSTVSLPFDGVSQLDHKGSSLDEQMNFDDQIIIEEKDSNTDSDQNKLDEFLVSDLVWGKVRSHPWWPGKIFSPSDASEKAMKYYKSDCFLVAYFGDRTFGWNEATLLKPFRSHFSHVEKQSNSLQFSVNCALDEVSRRVQLGLACSCIPRQDFERIKHQVVENTGIKPESSTREGIDSDFGVEFFDPKQLVGEIKSLALCSSSGADMLSLVIARSQLQAFSRFHGICNLREFASFDDSDGLKFEDEINECSSISENDEIYHKEKQMKKKDKFVFDSYSNEIDVVSPSEKRRKGVESSIDEISDEKKSKVSSFPKPSFKIGECIRRVASQMKSQSIKSDGISEEIVGISAESEPKTASSLSEYSSFDDLLAHFLFLAEHPYRKHNLSNTLMKFFFDFRNSIIINQNDKHGRIKEVPYLSGSPESFEFEDMNDNYWTDRVIQNGSEKQPRRGRKRNNPPVLGKSNSKKNQSGFKKPVDENAAAELVMHFPVADAVSVPSESNLNRMFKRFGPLKESDTEVDRNTNRARVVFKKSCDGEAAYSSASKFNIFGQTLVNYQLNYSISSPFKSSSLGDEDGSLFLEY